MFLLAQRRAFPVAAYLAYGLAQLEVRALLLDSVAGMLRQQVGMIRRGNVLVAASFRSYSAEVVEAAELAHAQGAAVIAITDQPVSPLAQFAKVLAAGRRRSHRAVPLAGGAVVRCASAGDGARVRKRRAQRDTTARAKKRASALDMARRWNEYSTIS